MSRMKIQGQQVWQGQQVMFYAGSEAGWLKGKITGWLRTSTRKWVFVLGEGDGREHMVSAQAQPAEIQLQS